ncbi:FliM/FliN family flagellar motor C-terminal domain-containing protein [Planctomycetes bacterium K23_9]|uniref:FliM/FliN family flagellar motor C-terminal domain-containing protein n=1 Tax=Stieleria marina TaxID=1930275 RepID=UPI0011A75D80
MKSVATPQRSHADRVLATNVQVTATLAEKTITMGDALNLVPGSVLRFSQRCDASLRIDVSGKAIASGKAVKVGDRLGVQID